MKINRPMATENTRSLLLFLVIVTALSLTPMLSHAAVFWDDEMESTSSPFYYPPNFVANGAYAFDTNVKMSGNGSIRLNYPPACQTLTTANQCGGSATRTFPLTKDVWKRVYFRMSGTGPNPTASGAFETSVAAFTKMLKGQSTTVNGLVARNWWTMGCCTSKSFKLSMEHVPIANSTTVLPSSITLADNRWYCIETHEKMNTPGLPDGIAEAWVDGVKVAMKTDVIWQRAGSTLQWTEFSIFRQIGIGNIWWDRFAAGDTRIGCLGATDTTPPAPPQGFVLR